MPLILHIYFLKCIRIQPVQVLITVLYDLVPNILIEGNMIWIILDIPNKKKSSFHKGALKYNLFLNLPINLIVVLTKLI